eukprot:TRINITY_DN6006_c0_g1_i1.p1 TRINITY_DN6006_c0_g1~~TRINITY_DN6006_c0_g1_i1.p1  ORF type:complete len:601 (+),score=163.09 TRINITY_DN6006_c0_g1_i1:269-1804(+)
MSKVQRMDNSDVGLFFVIPEAKRVEYQRRNSAWAAQGPHHFDFSSLFAPLRKGWLHVTGISPMTTPNAALNWADALEAAQKHNLRVSMDFNHRPQLGTLEKLWEITKAHLGKLDILILSLESLKGLCGLEGVEFGDDIKGALLLLHNKLKVRLAYCDKKRYFKEIEGKDTEVQVRFSVITDNSQLYSTEEYPVHHIPKDECGGGSAWAAGYILGRNEFQSSSEQIPWKAILRRADLLAALCQESVGDHSTVTRNELLHCEKMFVDSIADITNPNLLKTTKEEKVADLKDVVVGLCDAKIIPILRAKNTQLTIERSIQLIEMGCGALEITMDTPDILNVLQKTKQYIDSSKKKCLLGVGTILHKDQVQQVAGLVQFAISPIFPKDFVTECKKYNILAIPGASSPQELWNTKLEGAQVVKLFPSQLWTPGALKEVLNVGPLGELKVMATGGITPEKYQEWLSAGAVVVGMGSRLCGGDLKYNETDPEYAKEHLHWTNQGAKLAADLFAKVKSQ